MTYGLLHVSDGRRRIVLSLAIGVGLFIETFRIFTDTRDRAPVMKHTLTPGLSYTHNFVVTEVKTVPALYPESEEFLEMPAVFATGFLVGLVEWACVRLLTPYLDWPNEQTLGVNIDISHEAPTPPGIEVSAVVKLNKIDGRRLLFNAEVHDTFEIISRGTHERFIVDRTRFDAGIARKSPK